MRCSGGLSRAARVLPAWTVRLVLASRQPWFPSAVLRPVRRGPGTVVRPCCLACWCCSRFTVLFLVSWASAAQRPLHCLVRRSSGHGVPHWPLRMCHHYMALRRCGEPIIVHIRPQRCRDIPEQRRLAGRVVHRRDVTGYREVYVEIPQHVFF